MSRKIKRPKFIKLISSFLAVAMIITPLGGCSNSLGLNNQQRSVQSSQNVSEKNNVLINKIASTIRKRQIAGHLAQIPAALYNIPAHPHANSAGKTKSVGEKLEEFYSEPENALTEISHEEKGTEKLELLDAIYSEESADVVAEKAGKLDRKAQVEYESKLEKMATQPDTIHQSIAQGIVNPKTKKSRFI